MYATLAATASGAGFAIGLWAMWLLTRARLSKARQEAEATLQQARAQAEDIRKAGQAEYDKQKTILAERATRAKREAEAQLEEYEKEVVELESLAGTREADLTTASEEVEAQGQSLDANKNRLKELKAECREVRQGARRALEERSGQTKEEAIATAVAERVSKSELDAQIWMRDQEQRIAEVASIEARRLLALAIDRYNGVGHLERVQNTIAIADMATLVALSDPESESHKAFSEDVGCELIVDESASTVSIRGDDPLARELARRVMRQVANRPLRAGDRVRELVSQVKSELDREVQNAGRKAFRLLHVGKAHPEVMNLVGRLKYRLSYSQNQWKHSVEVGYMAGILAEEMGLDVQQARRGGLLHDIGKAMTHDHEGSHAVLGAQAARRCGEDPIVSNAIGSHHNDEPAETPLAHLVAAADAISGARPGARREAVTLYMDRIKEIHRIASSPRAVCRVDVMQAGREVRVVVAGDERGEIEPSDRSHHSSIVLPDEALHPLAQEIARAIEEQVTFPGQIRVTVIRESRSVSIAR